MNVGTRCTVFGYGVIAVGLVLAFVSAVVPHYTHHKLAAGVLLAGVLPYVVYGIVAVFMRNLLTVAVGAVLLAVHAALVINERFGGIVDYGDSMMYFVPAAVALAMLPLMVVALRKPWHR